MVQIHHTRRKMKVLVIPDVHLKPDMFTKADYIMERLVVDRAVCLMDIPDDWNKEYCIEAYVETFDRAIAFAKKYPNTLWTYGNHDLCYMWDERESGYSMAAAWTVRKKLLELKKALPEGNEIKYIHKIDNVLFCHGGLREEFVKWKVPSELHEDTEESIAWINNLCHDDMWNPYSPIWHRPQDYKAQLYKQEELLQVVGHTPVEEIVREGNVISCDVFSTYANGRPIGTREFLLLDTENWKFSAVKV